MALANYQDVADLWRPLTSAEQDQAMRLIGKASAMLIQKCPFDLQARITLHGIDPANPQAVNPDVAAIVVAGIVKRVMVNPDGVASTSETVGPYSKSANWLGSRSGSSAGSSPDSRMGLSVTDEDIAALQPTQGYNAPFTIRTRPEHHGEPCDDLGLHVLYRSE